jgi:protein-S-isoprenylcysteine O-methyltransferase
MAPAAETRPTEAFEAEGITSLKSTGRRAMDDATSMINRGGLGHAPRPVMDYEQPQPPPDDILRALDLYEKNFLPGQSRSLSGIALRAFLLGITFCMSLTLSLYLLYFGYPIWRAPFFITCLSLFHFLEFWTTSMTNTASACISSFLLSSNGSAYAIAHSASIIETLLSHFFFGPFIPATPHYFFLLLGLALMLVGQGIRAKAMLTAGKSFSHIVAHTKKTTHALVTTGVYEYFRHPSYFGYFWWAVGTQLMCGNIVCLVGYVVVLHRFFSRRIEGEEELLIRFFGKEYVDYRARTLVGIPFIQ